MRSQVIVIADPAIAYDMLRDKSMDKSKRAYAILDAVSSLTATIQHGDVSMTGITNQWFSIHVVV